MPKTIDAVRPKRSAGDAKEPSFEWCGGKTGYLWVGDGTRCLITLTTAEARRLRDYLSAHIDGQA